MNISELANLDPWEWPEDAKATIAAALADREASVEHRILAAELAGDLVVMDDSLAATLIAALTDAGEPEQVRAQAAISLGPVLEQCDADGFDEFEAEDPSFAPPISQKRFVEAQRALRAVLDDESAPKLARRRALEAVVRAPEDWHPAAIRKAYQTADADWKLSAVFAMGYAAGFDRQIVENLANPDADVRFEAVRAAGQREVAAAWPAIARILRDRKADKDLLLASIEAAPSVNSEQAVDLLEPLADSPDEEIAEAADEAIAACSDRSGGEDDF